MIEWLYIVVAVLSLLYIYFTWNNYYWSRKGVKQIDPLPLIGNMKDTFLFKRNIFNVCLDNYKKFSEEDAVGVYIMTKPALMIRNPDLIQQVLVKDFSSFHDNYVTIDQRVDPYVFKDPFVSRDADWKINRAAIVPTVSGAKLKMIFPQMKELSKQLEEYVDKNLNSEIEVKNLSFLFTTDVVSNCFFGIKGNSFTGTEAVFKKIGELMVEDFNNPLKFLAIMVFPLLTYIFNWTVFPKSVTKYLLHVITESEEMRKKNNIERNDFLQYILNLRGKPKKNGTDEVYSDIDVVGYAMTIFTEGFETSSITSSFALYELAKNPDIQYKARNEILSIAADSDGLDIDKLNNIPYLDQIISETLRMHPVLLSLVKECTSETSMEIGGKQVIIEKGTPIIIPVNGLHYDEKYYPEPEKFEPDRFSEDNIKSRPPCTHLAFGGGPRICSGMRFGLTQVKLFLAVILLRYTVHWTDKTPKQIILNKLAGLNVCNDLWLKFVKR